MKYLRSHSILFVVLALTVSACGTDRETISDTDGGRTDSSVSDSGANDSGARDSGTDLGVMDAGDVDAGDVDAGDVDAGDVDAGDVDAGDVDAGDVDAGPVDAGPIDSGVPTCDDGNPCTVDTVGDAGCEHVAGNSGTECRAAAGLCDVAETCDGESSACPDDVFATEGTECGEATAPCDTAEYCSGSSAACPSDTGPASEGTVCRAATSLCDVAETCDGTSISCPADAAMLTPYLYGATGGNTNSNIYQLNLDGSVASMVGPIGVSITGMAQDPVTRVVYGVTTPMSPTNAMHLYTIDVVAGTATDVGSLDGTVADITFDTDGTLFGWSEASDDLATINLTTGLHTAIADSMIDSYGSGLAFANDGTLYFVGEGNAGPFRIMNKVTGLESSLVATLSGAPGSMGDSINALAVHPITGVLYGVNNSFGSGPSYLVSINTTTGAVTSLGMSINRLDGIAFVCR